MLRVWKQILNIPPAGSFSSSILDDRIVGAGVIQRLDAAIQTVLNSVFQNTRPSSSLLPQLETLLLYAWQELNTGKWSEVNVNWHKLYAAVSWLKAVATVNEGAGESAEELGCKVIKICDMGHLLGGDVWDGILIKTISNVENAEWFAKKKEGMLADGDAERASKRLKPSSRPEIHRPIPTIHLPSLSTFKTTYLSTHTPLIIKGALDTWPALSKWSPEHIRQICGSRTVPVELGRRYTDSDWGQQLMTIGEFIDRYIYRIDNPEGRMAYLAQHDLFAQAPVLAEDISAPDYIAFCGDDDPDVNAWFGPEGTVSPLHHDPKENLLCQVMGEKYVRLYREEESSRVYPHESKMLFNTSQVDVENPDLERFPKFKEAQWEEGVLEAGDVLYIPARCWHFVRSLSISFSVSFWFNGSHDSPVDRLDTLCDSRADLKKTEG